MARSWARSSQLTSFGFGFDAMGGKHTRVKLSPEVRAKILSSVNMFENALRLFDKNSYGYVRTNKRELIAKIYPNDSNVPLNILQSLKGNINIDKIFNQEQQGLETVKLRTVIKEDKHLLKYLDRKENVEKNDIKNLENIKIKSK